MEEQILLNISKKLNVLISISLRHLRDDKSFGVKSGRKGAGDSARYLADLGLDAKDIAQIVGSPISSVRAFLTPTQRK
jgi:hypothetical protein